MSKRRKRPRPAKPPEREAFFFKGGSVAREGRFIEMRTTEDVVAHGEFVQEFLKQIPKIEAERQGQLGRLRDVLGEAGAAECVAFASLMYLQKDPDTYRESEDERSPAHVEFLALQALPILSDQGSAPRERLPLLTGEAIQLVRDAFDTTTWLMGLRDVEARQQQGGDPAFHDYRRLAMGEALAVRGTAYSEHTKTILDGCFAPFEEDCRRVLGFSAGEAWQLIQAIPDVIGPRVQPRLNDARAKYEATKKTIKRLRRKGASPPELAGLPPSRQQSWLRTGYFGDALSDPVELALLTAQELSHASGVPIASCAAWLEMMHCPPTEYVEAHHHAPVGGHPLTRLPLLKLENGYLAPMPSSLPEALRPRMEDAIRAADADLWRRYEAHRGRWLEQTATSRLQGALPGSSSWTGIPWTARNDSSDLDGLVHCDDLGLRIQTKAGRISAAARRGAPSMTEDLTAVISDAMHQHTRLTHALTSQTAVELGFTADQAEALSVPVQMEVVVCLDDVTVWSTETHKLRQLVSVPNVKQVPWVVSLADLLATTDLLDGTQLVHYLTRRQRLEREGRIEAHDELDWVGHYIAEGLFFDIYLDGPNPPDVFRLMSYTEPIDSWYFSRAGLTTTSLPKPEQSLPRGLARLIKRLETDRPPHWLTASVFLINGDGESRRLIDEFLDHTAARAAKVGWSNASQRFDSYGITLWADNRCVRQGLVDILGKYADEKIIEHERPNWIAIGLDAIGSLSIVVRETRPEQTLAHSLLRREASRPTATYESTELD